MPIYLPIAEMSVNAFEIIFLGVAVGFFSGLFGVGGGFLALPFLVFMGIPPTVAVTTQSCQILASSTAGVLSQWKKKRIDFKLANHMMLGGAGGLAVGLIIFQTLKFIGQLDFAIAFTYTLLLAGIGLSMAFEIIRSYLSPAHKPTDSRVLRWFKSLPHQTHYPVSGISISLIGPLVVGFLSGLMISILGSGGSFMIVPAMIYFLGVPALMITGTTLLQLMVLAAVSCIMYAATTHSVDLVLAALLIAGSVVGAILGLRAAKYIKGRIAHLLLAVLILIVAGRMGYELLIEPADPFTLIVER